MYSYSYSRYAFHSIYYLFLLFRFLFLGLVLMRGFSPLRPEANSEVIRSFIRSFMFTGFLSGFSTLPSFVANLEIVIFVIQSQSTMQVNLIEGGLQYAATDYGWKSQKYAFKAIDIGNTDLSFLEVAFLLSILANFPTIPPICDGASLMQKLLATWPRCNVFTLKMCFMSAEYVAYALTKD